MGGTLERWFECLALRVCRREWFFCTHTQKASPTLGFEHVSEGSMPNHGRDKVGIHSVVATTDGIIAYAA